MRATTRLRQLLASGPTLFVPGCYNALSARILEAAGFPAVYMTGYGTSLALLGMPDAGLATMTEMHLNARYIANAVVVPVIADADNGYGNAVNVIRAVREYIQTGVAAIHLEDQVVPKRCGHVAGRQVIPLEEAVGKYRAADMVRRDLDPDFVLIARTDARGAHGGSLDEAIRRANAYLEAGADLAFVEGPTSVDEVRRICREVAGPVFYNMTGVSPRLSRCAAAARPTGPPPMTATGRWSRSRVGVCPFMAILRSFTHRLFPILWRQRAAQQRHACCSRPANVALRKRIAAGSRQ